MKLLITLLVIFPWSLLIVLGIALLKLIRRGRLQQLTLPPQPSPTYDDVSKNVVPIDADHITYIGRA